MGYDGKGQARIMAAADADTAWETIGRHAAVLEDFVTFAHEFSVILRRGIAGEIRFWDSPVNVHKSGILRASSLPPPQIISDHTTEPPAPMQKSTPELD